MTHGYSLNASYAWQKAISESTGYATWDRAAVRGRDSALRQQQVIVYGLLQLPFGRSKMFLSHANSLINQVVGGWEVSPVINYASGLPYTLSYGFCGASNVGSAPCQVNGDARTLNKRVTGFPGHSLSFYPDYTNPTSANQKPGYVFTPNAVGQGTFSAPGVDQIGTAGRNSAFGPHSFNTDLSVQKNFTIHEGTVFQLRADGFNAFNHINWGTPDGNITDNVNGPGSGGGGITSGPLPNSSSNPRQLQFSARVQF